MIQGFYLAQRVGFAPQYVAVCAVLLSRHAAALPLPLAAGSAGSNPAVISAYTKKTPVVGAFSIWRRGWDSNPRALARKLISSQPRYDHFDTSPGRVSSRLAGRWIRAATQYNRSVVYHWKAAIVKVGMRGRPAECSGAADALLVGDRRLGYKPANAARCDMAGCNAWVIACDMPRECRSQALHPKPQETPRGCGAFRQGEMPLLQRFVNLLERVFGQDEAGGFHVFLDLRGAAGANQRAGDAVPAAISRPAQAAP